MFGKGRPINECPDGQLAGGLIFGTVICLIVVIPTFFNHHQPGWFLWIIRGFGAWWLIGWWRPHLGEMLRRKSGR